MGSEYGGRGPTKNLNFGKSLQFDVLQKSCFRARNRNFFLAGKNLMEKTYQVGLELSEIDVEGTIESERSGD